MKTSSDRNQKIITSAVCAAALAALAAIAPQARAAYGTAFTFDLNSTFYESHAYGISGTQQVGYATFAGSTGFTQKNGVLWSGSAGTAVSLEPTNLGIQESVAYATNGRQQVGSGLVTPGSHFYSHALLWSGTGTSAVDLNPTNLPGFQSSYAYGISGNQQVGSGGGPGVQGTALLWSGSANTAVALHPTNLSGFTYSEALATSGSQQVGFGHLGAPNTDHALLWSGSADSAVDLHPTNLSGFSISKANGVGGGQQVGYGFGTSGSRHALLWASSADSAVDLTPTNLPGYTSSSFTEVAATNGIRQVGYGTPDSTTTNAHALLWSGAANTAIDLDSLLPGDNQGSSVAHAIDAYGNISGDAYPNHAVEWLNGNLYNIGGTGAWATSSNWMSGTPANGHDVMLLQADATNRTITYTNSNGAIVLGKLTIDATGNGAMTLAQAQDSLKTTSEVIGLVGRGILIQTGGTHLAGATTINANSVVNYNGGSYSAGSVAINGNGRIVLSAGENKVLTVSALSLDTAGGAKIDVSDNSMQINYAGGSPLATIGGYIKTGYANGNWTGNGITSSAAAAASASAHKTALGYAEGSVIGAGSSTVVVRYTYSGDANLDGKVDTLDFNSLAGNFGGTGKIWSQADFNFDGVVDTLDFNNLAANFGQQISESTSSPASAGARVPEPGAMLWLPMLALATHWRRRRIR